MLEAFSLIGKIALDGADKVNVVLEDIDKKGQKLEKTLTSMGSGMQKTGKAMSKYLTVPLAAAGTAITKIGSDFEQGMAEVQAISGATIEQMEMLEQAARDAKRFTARESASAFKYMAMAGWEAQEMLDGLDGILNATTASGEDLALVADIITDALTAFGMSAAQSTELADLLANTAMSANTNIGMLGESFKYVAPIFGSLSYSAEDAALALGLMANAGIKSSQAGTTLRAAVNNLVNPTGEAVEVMNQLGIKTTDAQGKMLPFKDLLDNLRETFAGLTEEQQAQYAATLFGQQAMSGMLAIINASDEDYQKLTEATKNYAGAAEEAADTMSNTLQGRLKELKVQLEELALMYFEIIEPVLVKTIELATKVAEGLQKMPEPLKEVTVILATLAAVAGPLLIYVGKIITAVTKIGPLLAKIGPAFAKIGPFLAKAGGLLAKIGPMLAKLIGLIKAAGAAIAGVVSGPVALVIAVIGVLIGLAALLIKHWDKVKVFFGNLWEGIKEGFSNFVGWFTDKWSGIVEFLKKINLFEIGKNIISSLWEGIKFFWTSIFDGIKEFGGKIIGGFKKVFGIASPSKVFEELGTNIGEGLELGLLDGVDGVGEAMRGLTDAVNNPLEDINSNFDEFSNKLNTGIVKKRQQKLQKAEEELIIKAKREEERGGVGRDIKNITGNTVKEVIHKHEGTIKIEGVSNDGEFRRVVELVVEEIIADQRRELRMA